MNTLQGAARAVPLRGRRVLVMGLGRFGGSVGVSRFLVEQGAQVTVTDQLGSSALQASIAALEGLPIRWRLGGHHEEDFTSADLIVVNPAVPAHRASTLRSCEPAPTLRTGKAGGAGLRIHEEASRFVPHPSCWSWPVTRGDAGARARRNARDNQCSAMQALLGVRLG